MSDSFMEFGFGQNDSGIGNRQKKFKAEKGKTYRIGFAWWHGMEAGKEFGHDQLLVPEGQEEESLTPRWIGAQRNFFKGGAGYVINKGPEYTQLAGESPKTYAATIIVLWPLGQNNKPTKESLLEKLPVVLPWVLGAAKYEQLKKQHVQGYPMHDWDVNAELDPQKDVTYQDFNFLPAKNCIFKEMLKNSAENPRAKEVCDHIMEQVRKLSADLGTHIGRDLTIDQVKEALGQEVAGPVASSVSSDAEVDSMLESMDLSS
jgi:hypothetical protein